MEQKYTTETIESKVTLDNLDSKWEINGEITRDWIFSLLAEGWDTYDIIKNYEVSELVILENMDLLDKEVIKNLNLSETFIKNALKSDYFDMDDIKDLTMMTYSKLSDDFLKIHSQHINWERMILYICTQDINFDKWTNIIEEKNLWKMISANNLPTEFIREWKDKLDWILLSIVKEFNDAEKLEFADLIVVTEKKFESENSNREFSIDDIANMMDDIYGN